ncbi:type I methionyl aminopeptidase [Acidiluteibacter ferrifornacis]|uniref:Methionine aminopeptidase n=1 Tax=Acidiluteibacter ferrifornacis TaxID=2692424 RepID=A0A6N9NGQ3_9FLAO|nr:type I methionyl aminopeptidase [Acidiluteibacter ferrifornacis]NBG65828.1 type I methionyl aminopeptidase [Acidiluteibacter ferrifornacis]
MIYLKTEEEIELIRQSSLLVGKTLAEVAPLVKPGITTLELDKIAEEFIRDNGGVPSFKNYNGFPNTLCASLNEAVVHGIPNNKPLKDGDIISLDCGVFMNGFHGDVAYTFEVGDVSDEIKNLLRTTKESLELGIAAAIAGNRIGDIGYAIQAHAESRGYGVVRELVGHGLGRELHEGPEVPNYGKRGSGMILKEGLVIAIEPMINLKSKGVRQDKDGWTIITSDNKPSAHFEHDVVVRKGKAEVLSTHEYIEEALNKQLK